MRRATRLVGALALDALLGDPQWLPHPVKLMGKLAWALEGPFRRIFADEKVAGVGTAATVVSTSALTAAGIVRVAQRWHPQAGEAAAVLLLWTCIAPRDLGAHAQRVAGALARADLQSARRAAADMVGRDTTCLDKKGCIRAAVESVAENTVDAVTSPLLYGFLGGAPAAMAFKAASTLDSLFGYKTPRYLRFGWASARLDDVLNYLPARITPPFIAAAAALAGLDGRGAFWTAVREGSQHPSPNSGLAEAAFAGALGVRLGGPVTRGDTTVMMPWLGQPHRPLQTRNIAEAVMVMRLTGLLLIGLLVWTEWLIASASSRPYTRRVLSLRRAAEGG